MRVLDLHADLGMDVLEKHHSGEDNVLTNHHIDKLKKGEVMYSAAACFFSGEQSWQDMQEMVEVTKKEMEESDITFIHSKEDFDEDNEKVSLFLTIEGMCGIKDNAEEKIQWLYDQGCIIGSLCWNDENALATGNGGSPLRGLTEMGKAVIKKMNDLHMIIDVSHANEKTFWDIIECSNQPIIATHSNAKALCFVDRNLTDQQIRAIVDKGGLIGMNCWKNFISKDESQQNALNLAKHAKYMADLVGHQYVACGFDFMDFLGRDSYDISSADKTQNFIQSLYEVGFTEEEVKDIAYRNAIRFLKEYL